jgi:hypothetical protein
MDIYSTISDEYFNYIINPSKIAGNFSVEKINLYIIEFTTRLDKIKTLPPQYITQELVSKAHQFKIILASLNLAYIMKESEIVSIPPPSGMSWLLNCNLNP